MTFKTVYQQDSMDCGAACLAMLLNHYGRHVDMATVRFLCGNSKNGLSLLGINNAAQKLGFETKAVRLSFEALIEDAPLPCILHWKGKHFIVIYKIGKNKVYVADPAIGKVSYTFEEFTKEWTHNEEGQGFALLLSPSDNFNYEKKQETNTKQGWNLLKYIKPHTKQLVLLLLLLLLASLMSLVLPFLTQAIVDKGIQNKDISLLVLILLGQLALTIGYVVCGFLQNRLVLITGTRINISLLKDFFVKLVRLPLSFFDERKSGDILQRMSDLSRIEQAITISSLQTLISICTLIVYSIVLASYQFTAFIIFFASSVLYIFYISLFLQKKKAIDYDRFTTNSENQSEVIQFVEGIQEIKLNNCPEHRLNKWNTLQQKLMRLKVKNLKINQLQQFGGSLITKSSDFLIIYICAVSVINGNMTLGAMLAIQSVLGSLRVPIDQFVRYIQEIQEVKISCERTKYVYDHREEQEESKTNISLPNHIREIRIDHISFAYDGGASSKNVIDDLSLVIPANKITAIVGVSGSGKTTLMKLILGTYAPQQGQISVDGIDLRDINIDEWRDRCGIVMQGGFLFSDTIARNIALKDKEIDYEKVKNACQVACIDDFVAALPLKYNTIIGADGIGLSMGQKQRFLIARAIYKNPSIAIFDEATNSLDTTNEKTIYNNLQPYFAGRTAIVIAHRLSTVKNADNIVVIDHGKIAEQGTHTELVSRKGAYYQLVKDQLELENV